MVKHHHYESITYLYDTEEEKEIHGQEMKLNGFEDSGKHSMRMNEFFISNPEYRLCGVYYKCHN